MSRENLERAVMHLLFMKEKAMGGVYGQRAFLLMQKRYMVLLFKHWLLPTLCEARVWQHLATLPNSHFEALKHSESPRNRVCAVSGASLGEDKYFLIF